MTDELIAAMSFDELLRLLWRILQEVELRYMAAVTLE